MPDLSAQTTRHSVYLEGLKAGEIKKFGPFLKRMDKSIRLKLAGTDLTAYSRTRLEKLLASLGKDLRATLAEYQAVATDSMVDVGLYEAGFESRSINKVLDGFESVIPAAEQVAAAIMSSPLSVRGADGGKLLKPFMTDWTAVESKRITGAIRQGYFEGQTTNSILQTVRGTRAKGFTDGVLGITNRNAAAVVRTGLQHAASTARMETWKANDDIIEGYRWLSTLDGRTSGQCRNLDNQFFKLGEGPLPPIHVNCRSTTMAEVSSEFAVKQSSERASKDGPVKGNSTYYSWLKKQPIKFQEDVIGIKRAKLMRDGGLSSERFTELNMGRNFKPLSLAEMEAKEPLAFARIRKDS